LYKKPENLQVIREYGETRFGESGKQKPDESDEDYAKRFMTAMRQVEWNTTLNAVPELNWLANAKPDQVANLINLQSIVQSTNFKVMILGEFKRGKSTFINALLGEEILPAFATPCTAIINEVKWGERQRAVLHFNQVDGQEKKEPKEIPVDEIEEYVVIKEDVDQSQAINESPYEKLELFWPLELCKDRVEIIDSPGLNEHKTRQQVTESYLPLSM
jgi:ribosome biogenesis GTPase A